jgi:hypothetical protein
MADIDRFSARLIDLAERFADVTDAAQGRGNRQGGIQARWLLLPAAGAGLYALGARGAFRGQAKSVLKQARERAAELPDDLMSRVQAATTTSSGASSGSSNRRSASSSSSRSTGRARSRRRRRPQTSSAR